MSGHVGIESNKQDNLRIENKQVYLFCFSTESGVYFKGLLTFWANW